MLRGLEPWKSILAGVPGPPPPPPAGPTVPDLLEDAAAAPTGGAGGAGVGSDGPPPPGTGVDAAGVGWPAGRVRDGGELLAMLDRLEGQRRPGEGVGRARAARGGALPVIEPADGPAGAGPLDSDGPGGLDAADPAAAAADAAVPPGLDLSESLAEGAPDMFGPESGPPDSPQE